MEQGIVAEVAAHLHPVDHEVLDVVLFHLVHELRGFKFCVFLTIARALDHLPKQKRGHANQQPEQHGFYS